MRCAADIDEVGWPEPAAVEHRIESTASWAASSFHSCTVPIASLLEIRPSESRFPGAHRSSAGSAAERDRLLPFRPHGRLQGSSRRAPLREGAEHRQAAQERGGRHKHLLADGWREMERRQEIDHIWVRYERTGPPRSACGCHGPRRTRAGSSAARASGMRDGFAAGPAAVADRPSAT